MKPFTHLFSSITSSSIWRAPKEVRLTWITMLAKADKDGEVWASVGGLADEARITREECLSALEALLSPDDDSRTKEHEGRRIVAIDGGWRLLNYKKYYGIAKAEDRKAALTEAQRNRRQAKMADVSKCKQVTSAVSTSNQESPKSSGQAQLKRALRMRGLPTIGEAVQEWSDMLRGLCLATTLEEALEDLDHLLTTAKAKGITVDYSKHVRDLAERRGRWRTRQRELELERAEP